MSPLNGGNRTCIFDCFLGVWGSTAWSTHSGFTQNDAYQTNINTNHNKWLSTVVLLVYTLDPNWRIPSVTILHSSLANGFLHPLHVNVTPLAFPKARLYRMFCEWWVFSNSYTAMHTSFNMLFQLMPCWILWKTQCLEVLSKPCCFKLITLSTSGSESFAVHGIWMNESSILNCSEYHSQTIKE